MSRNVPSQMQTHYDGSATTVCRLLKIRSRAGVIFGLTTLDTLVPYDDNSGDGVVDYVATSGFDPSTLRSDLGYGVDNAEGMALISDEIDGITNEMVDAGEFDDGTWVCYEVNFKDLTAGRHVQIGSGDIGDIRTRYGMVWIPELLGLIIRLKQPVGSSFSRRCRAVFGVAADASNGQRGCGVDAEALWVSGEVQSVGAESNRVFTGDAVATPHSFPGRVEFLTGNNVGREYATESVSGFVVTLNETTAYPIEAGDTYQIRPDCGKSYIADCIGVWSNGDNFKGEPHIPDGGEVASVT
jgi:uncharacterized phage protein (TIGR02218 family)